MKRNDGLREILKKSAHLMAQRGYEGTSMRDLAGATDRSLAGLYHYFKSKEEVLYEINFEGFSTLRKAAEDITSTQQSPRARLLAFIANHVRYFTAHMDEMRVMMLGTTQMDSAKGRKVRALKAKYAQVGQAIVSDFLREESGPRVSEAEIARGTYLLFGMMNWIFGWYTQRKHGSEEELIEHIFRTFTSGASSRPQSLKPQSLKNGSRHNNGHSNGHRLDRQAV